MSFNVQKIVPRFFVVSTGSWLQGDDLSTRAHHSRHTRLSTDVRFRRAKPDHWLFDSVLQIPQLFLPPRVIILNSWLLRVKLEVPIWMALCLRYLQ
jgi:hypothetical protein